MVVPPGLTLWRRFWPVSLMIRSRSAAGLKSTPNEAPFRAAVSWLIFVAAAVRVFSV